MNFSQSTEFEESLQTLFHSLSEKMFRRLNNGEHLRLSLHAEQTQFTRLSGGRVRQNGLVEDIGLSVQFISPKQSVADLSVSFVTEHDELSSFAERLLGKVREQAEAAPQDPFVSLPGVSQKSEVRHQGRLLSADHAVDALSGGLSAEDDLVGIYAGGRNVVAYADSAGSSHWFSGESFFVDYSLWMKSGRAVKSCYAGRDWDQAQFLQTVDAARENLRVLSRPVKTLNPGHYRVFLAPSAASELLHMLSWGALSEGALQRNDSPLCALRRGEKQFSPLFSLCENYQLGLTPRFTSDGEFSPELVPLFEKGRLVQALCSARTAKEYGLQGNGSAWERLRTPDLSVGDLAMSDCLKELGTGLYLSDLHYLNWSDMMGGRITGMTRYGCVWVENCVPQGPIQDMRFDETIFRCFGSELLSVTREAQLIPETSTYGSRSMGGARVPGMLLGDFKFTL
ncbi:MAG: hypothetical protein RLZZ488_1687 [Pseudomonadota bacterium]|jgi:predicted Zn-dependent protease